MKRLITLLTILLITGSELSAQWTTSGTNIYYNAGNVGIGTTAPAYKLDVNGMTRFSGPLTLFGSQQAPNYILANEYADNSQLLIRAGSSASIYSQIEVTGNWDGTNQINGKVAFRTSGTERMQINAAGNVGIGTTTPASKVDIVGTGGTTVDFQTTGRARIKGSAPGIWINDNSADRAFIGCAGSGNPSQAVGIFTNTAGWNFNVMQNGSIAIGSLGTNANAVLDVTGNIFANGKVLIGLSGLSAVDYTNKISTYMLAVNGDAIFNRAKVKLYGTWPDFVFEEKYGLLPLEDLDKFIQSNKHLPNVPAAAAVEKDGLDLGDNQALLLQKIEELTLYTIEQNKKNNQQQEQINKLLQEVEALKTAQKK